MQHLPASFDTVETFASEESPTNQHGSVRLSLTGSDGRDIEPETPEKVKAPLIQRICEMARGRREAIFVQMTAQQYDAWKRGNRQGAAMLSMMDLVNAVQVHALIRMFIALERRDRNIRQLVDAGGLVF
jgi:hypothetical protein